MSALTAADVWRDDIVKGDIHSGAHDPDKADVRRWGQGVEMRIGVGAARRTAALLAAVIPAAGTYPLGAVTKDPDPSKNGFWTWTETTWQFDRPFPDTVVALTSLGGTANAVTASSRAEIDPANVVVFLIQPTVTNTDNVTLAIDGAVSKPVLDVNGAELAPGLWTAGRLIQFIDNGDEYRLVSDPDADGAAASAAASATEAAGSIAIVVAARDEAIAARDVTLAAMSSVVPTIFATVAIAELYSPAVAPDFIQTAGKLATGDGGGALYKKAASEPAHDGKFSITLADAVTVVWFEYADNIINVKSFAETIHADDISLAFAAAWGCMTERGGGKIWFPHNNGVAYEWNTTTDVSFAGTVSIDGEDVTLQFGDNFAYGGADFPDYPLTISGNAATDITASISNLFSNYIKLSAPIAADKGARIFIADDRAASKWDTSGNNYRPCHEARVDYADTTKNIINFYPQIGFPAPVGNATTGEITKADMKAYLYNGDCHCTIGGGITFKGVLNPVTGSSIPEAAQNPGGASARGIRMKCGVFKVYANFYYCWTNSFEECFLHYANSQNIASFNGYGIKLVNRASALIENSVFPLSRHGIGIGGSYPDGARARIVNCKIGSARVAYDGSLYPSDEFRALDTHGNGYEVYVDNCEIDGGIAVAGDFMRVANSKIRTSQSDGCVEFSSNGRSNGILELVNCDLVLPRRNRPNHEGDGAGSFTQETYFFKDETANLLVGWSLRIRGGRVYPEDPISWPTPAVAFFNVGNSNFKEVLYDGVSFEFSGTPFREVDFNVRGPASALTIRHCVFDGCGVNIIPDTALDECAYVHFLNNKVRNLDGGTGQASSFGLQIGGETAITSPFLDAVIVGNTIESLGEGSMIIVSAAPVRNVTVKNNTLVYSGPGTLPVAIRTHRNQNVITAYRHVANVRGNTIHNVGGGTISLAIQISGLAAAGSVLEGRFYTGDNIHYAATSGITTTGTAASPV